MVLHGRVSCEENGKYGHVWQTDPRGIIQPQRTALVPDGGNYESFAYSIRGGRPEFFVTEDNAKGPLVRFQPDEAAMRCFNSSIPEDRWCTLNSGTHSFLRLSRGACRSGRIYWDSTKKGQGANYPFAEGIDCRRKLLNILSACITSSSRDSSTVPLPFPPSQLVYAISCPRKKSACTFWILKT